MLVRFLFTWGILLLCHAQASSQTKGDPQVVVSEVLANLLREEDLDGDTRITAHDPYLTTGERGDRRFLLHSVTGDRFEVVGTYHLSNLVQELILARETGLDTALIRRERIFELPADRISRNIRERYWHNLTRTVDEEGLAVLLHDEKSASLGGERYLYVPRKDTLALNYFTTIADRRPDLRLIVGPLETNVNPDWVRTLRDRHGLLSLALRQQSQGVVEGVPFVVPGGRFNEMYGWDSYFILLGLLQDGMMELAQSIVDNFVYEVEQYGMILNANRTYYLTRSQPPFLTSMIRAMLDHLPRAGREQWLRKALDAAMTEYYTVWMGPQRLTSIGLSRYFDSGTGPPPEVEPGHYSAIYASYARKFGMRVGEFESALTTGEISSPDLDEFFLHDRAMRESGHDTSYRLLGLCANLATVDLNSLLYKYEKDIALIIDQEFHGEIEFLHRTERSTTWHHRAERRKELVNRYLWNSEHGMFFDFDLVHQRQTLYVAATTFYAMWAGLASSEQATALVRKALPLLEESGGIAGSTEFSRGPVTPERPLRQWDYPHGWAPHQILVWQGLINYGYDQDARRLAYRWLYTITSNAVHFHGTVPEKFDVVNRTHEVFAEYGNIGTTFSYITKEGFGWTNASFQLGRELLSPEQRTSLNKLIPPEWMFP